MKKILGSFLIAFLLVPALGSAKLTDIDSFRAHLPIHTLAGIASAPRGITPEQIKTAYNLPKSGGSGTIAIIGAYEAPTIENDLNVFSKEFGLPACTTKNTCFEKHPMAAANMKKDSGWAEEAALDAEWAHAIAPNAKILLVEAANESGTSLLKAVDYARGRSDVVAISMSWGGQEFPSEAKEDTHFKSKYGATFFVASGDSGTGASWPAASSLVVGVGGTHLALGSNGRVLSESAWSGSGGGASAYIPQPDFQKTYRIPKSRGMRAVPDVAYNADPATGFSVYTSATGSQAGWITVGGTSAGAPQWAAIRALGKSASNAKFYADKAATSSASFFRDIVSGSNGDCAYFCDARKHYDYVTGLGSPQTDRF